MTRSRTRAKAQAKNREYAPPCPNCGEQGPHYVPPSLGESGFFACVNLTRKVEK